MMEPQGSQYNQAVLSPVAIDVYLIQVLVGRGDESVMIERVLGVWEQQAREGLIQFIWMLEVNVILFCVETKLGFFYSLIYTLK